jgi:hypothetical protein
MSKPNVPPDSDRGVILWFVAMGFLFVVFVIVAFIAYWKYLRH